VQINLTGSQKKRAKRKKNRLRPSGVAQATQAHDRAINLIRHVETLAGLLEIAGEPAQIVPLPGALISETGSMILDETDKLREVLETIHRTFLAHAAHR
jgi:hypothetical protein